MEKFKLSDQKLYELCRQYGEKSLQYRRKFAGLLPEVNRRKLFEKKGFSSIFEFAAKLCGMSKEQVERVIQLEKKFENKTVLKKILIEGTASVNKLARIASIATPENQEFLAEKIRILPNRALETFVRDEKFAKSLSVKIQNGLFEPKNGHDSVHVHNISELKLSPELIEKLAELQNKGININELILKFLEKREEEITEAKEKIVKEAKADPNVREASVSRYIPVKVRQLIRREHGTKCAVPNCLLEAKTLHHTARFSLVKEHNPYFIAPLCREHHLIAHAIDLNFREKRSAGVGSEERR